MFRRYLPALLSCLALHAQEAPRLPLEQIPLSTKMPNAASLGTVSSVAADRSGTIYVLQRGDKLDPVLAVDRGGRLLRSWGKGMFTVPHSIRVDAAGNIWTVDAGSSVVLKFSPEGKKLQQIDVGEVAPAEKCAFPTLCGTTDIAFGPDGRLFISDGYGNARILEYTSNGKRVRQWGSSGAGPGQFQIPHGIVYDGKQLLVADRTNSRVQRFDLDGRYLGEWTNLGRPFALKMNAGSLWVAGMGATPQILKVDPSNGKVLGQAPAPGPHSIDVNASEEVFAGGCCGGSNPNAFFWLRRTQTETRQ
jgi:DNA-binding beta-propeller fold protein YncE